MTAAWVALMASRTPVAAHASPEEDDVVMRAVVISEDGVRQLRERATAPRAEAAALGRRVADSLLARGAASMVALAPRAPAA